MLEIITYLAVVPFVIAVLLMYILFFSRFGQFYPHYFHIIGVSLFGCAIFFGAIFYSLAATRFLTTNGLDFLGHKAAASSVIVTFLTSVLYWAAVFHFCAFLFGHRITNLRLGVFSIFTQNWVKTIDYVYLLISIVSLLKIALSISEVETDNMRFTAYSTVALSIAVALRLTKTSIEIFSWDKPPTSRRSGAQRMAEATAG
jgi:hypothetical protein